MAEPKSKAELRATALAAREKLSDKQRTAAAGALAKRGLPIDIVKGLIVSGYSPIRNEIDPEPLMKQLAAQGARLALPSVNARGKALTFRAWTPGDRLMMGMLGIPEPSTAAAEVVPDIMLVPLAAFDSNGHRIGYGAGHYDRSLASLRAKGPVTAVGVAYSASEAPQIPDEPHDQRLDFILTERELIYCGRG
jgi:5-formyltetrahydrofolate cyclo-ligase